MVEQDHTVERNQRMMEAELDDACPKPDLSGPFRRGGYHSLRRSDVLPPSAVMLPDPGFALAESV